MFDRAHVQRLEAKHEPTHPNRGAAMFRLYFLTAMAALCISYRRKESNNMLNLRSTTTRPDLLPRLPP